MSEKLPTQSVHFRVEIKELVRKAFETGRDQNATGVAFQMLLDTFLSHFHDAIGHRDGEVSKDPHS